MIYITHHITDNLLPNTGENMTLKQKMYKLEKLKEERDRINKTPRWGVKSREINLPTYFQNLKENLTIETKGRIY